jgi:SAM-dependent methyltransferase
LNNSVTISNKPNIINWYLRALFLELTLQKLPKQKDILDLCCGYGFYFHINKNAFGIDGDLDCAREISHRINKQITIANINYGLPYQSKSFSYVISHDVFEHFEISQLEFIIHEVFRVLKPRGKLIILVPNWKGYKYGINLNIGHKTFITREIIDYLAKENFIVQENYSEPFPRFIGKYFTHNKEIFILEKCPMETIEKVDT